MCNLGFSESPLIASTRNMKTSFESFPVSLYEKSLSFDLSSRIHFSSCFFRWPAFTSDCNAFKYLEIVLDGGSSDKLLILSGMLLNKIAKTKGSADVALHYFFLMEGLDNFFHTKFPISAMHFLKYYSRHVHLQLRNVSKWVRISEGNYAFLSTSLTPTLVAILKFPKCEVTLEVMTWVICLEMPRPSC